MMVRQYIMPQAQDRQFDFIQERAVECRKDCGGLALSTKS
jgi:hypothetical protein